MQMDDIGHRAEELRDQIEGVEQRLATLRDELARCDLVETEPSTSAAAIKPKMALPRQDYARYGRQMIVPNIGLEGQLKLKAGSILVVGVGGLGCPAAAYLAAAGVGTVGLMDSDTVEESNLHRQILHRSDTVGMNKVDSALQYLARVNPTIRYVPHRQRLSSSIAQETFTGYDIILDCTDNPPSRYLISDTAVLLGRPVVSASALGTEGQLMILNHPARPPGHRHGGPCYRCIFPRPPSPRCVTACDEGGILGPVVGIMGTYQALEAIKILLAHPSPPRPSRATPDGAETSTSPRPALLLFSAYGDPPFRTVRLRNRRRRCAVCSDEATIDLGSLTSGSSDYLERCGTHQPTTVLPKLQRISARDYHDLNAAGHRHTLIDVREEAHFNVSNLEGSINLPFSELQSGKDISSEMVDRASASTSSSSSSSAAAEDQRIDPAFPHPIFVICRLGNDSQHAVRWMNDAGWTMNGSRDIKDIRGGLRAWKEDVDRDWPYV